MKKNKTTDKLKREYEKVYESPLNWCPRYGYLPEIKKTDFINNHENYLIALKCSELIEGTREYFFMDSTIDCVKKYISLPDVENFPYPHNNLKDICSETRLLFQNLDCLTLKMLSAVRGCQGISDKPVGRISNRRPTALSVIAGSVKLNDSLVTTNYLLSEAQKITGKELDYNHDAKQLYALYIILEAWLILTSLFFNPDRTKSKDALDDINDRIFYIYDLRDIAMRYYSRWEVEAELKEKEELEKKAAPYKKLQRDRANKKNDLTKEKNEPRNKYLMSQSREYLQKHGKTSIQKLYNHFLKKDIKKEMEDKKISLDIKTRQFKSIIAPVLNEYKEINK